MLLHYTNSAKEMEIRSFKSRELSHIVSEELSFLHRQARGSFGGKTNTSFMIMAIQSCFLHSKLSNMEDQWYPQMMI